MNALGFSEPPTVLIRLRLVTQDQVRYLQMLAQVSALLPKRYGAHYSELMAAVIMAKWIEHEERAERIRLDRFTREAIARQARQCEDLLGDRIDDVHHILENLYTQGVISA